MAAPAAYSRRSYAGGGFSTTIAAGLSNSATSCTPVNTTNWPSGSGGPFAVVIDRGAGGTVEEKAWCSSLSGGVLTFSQRGADGTSAVGHNPGCTITLCTTAQDADESNQTANEVLGMVTSVGDLLYANTIGPPNTLARLGIGMGGQFLGVSGGKPAWLIPSNGFLAPTIQTTTYTAQNGQIVVATSGTFTVTSPAATSGYVFGVANQGSGVLTLTSASGVFYGPGMGSSGVSSFNLGSYGAYAVAMQDGTNWHVFDGGQDSGWVAFPFNSSYWANLSGYTCAYRLQGNRVSLRGAANCTNSGNTTVGTLPSGFRPTEVVNFLTPIYNGSNWGSTSPAYVSVSTAGVVSSNQDASSDATALDVVTFTVD